MQFHPIADVYIVPYSRQHHICPTICQESSIYKCGCPEAFNTVRSNCTNTERKMSLQHPVVCEQIGQRELYLGSARAAAEGVERDFEHVVTVSSYEQPLTTAFFPLVDGPEVEYPAFKRAVEVTRRHYRRGESTLVQCEVGISRSAAIVATVLAAEEGTTFDEGLAEVKRYRSRASPRAPLRECAERYLRSCSRQRPPSTA
jgi:protein-tyrosine phosphatase